MHNMLNLEENGLVRRVAFRLCVAVLSAKNKKLRPRLTQVNQIWTIEDWKMFPGLMSLKWHADRVRIQHKKHKKNIGHTLHIENKNNVDLVVLSFSLITSLSPFLLFFSWPVCVSHWGYCGYCDPGGRLLEYWPTKLQAGPYVLGKPGQCLWCWHW